MNETRQLADYIADFDVAEVPAEVIDKAKLHLLDQIGCQMAFATLPWGKAACRYALADGARGDSTIAYYGARTSMEKAAFANGLFGHGFEMDDDDESSTSHPGVCVIPAALAVGEHVLASGRDVLGAIIVGYDVMIRCAHAARKMHERHFHETAAAGTFGATAAAAKLLGLSADQVANALGIAASESSGITEHTCTGGSVKRVNAGLAASNGVRAALLAQLGITGPTEALEGRKGWIRAFADDEECDPAKLVEGLGADYKIMQVGMKPYCCCAGMHGAIDAAEKIRRRGVTADDIASVAVMMRPRETRDIGGTVEPQDITQAQFSAQFGVALRLVRGSNGFYDYTMEAVGDPVVRELCRNIIWEVDEDDTYLAGSAAPARVTVTLKDGTVYQETVNNARGTLGNPIGWDGTIEKFLDLERGCVPDEQARALVAAVRSLDASPDIIRLTSLMTA